MSLNTLTSKDAALRAVGLTVVNFQRLEHKLKLAARLGPVQGTLPKIQRDLEKRVERTETLTLGQAIQAWLGVADSDPLTENYTSDLFDATMQMTFSLDLDTKSRNDHGAALKALLETRNKLIHGGLVQFQWDSSEECDRLVKDLNETNESIRSQLEFVTSILHALSAIRPEDLEIAQAELERQIALEEPEVRQNPDRTSATL